MIDPVSVSLIGEGMVITLKLIDTGIRRSTARCLKKALSSLKNTITRTQPFLNENKWLAMKKSRVKDSAVDIWYEGLVGRLKNASWIVQQTEEHSLSGRKIETLITNLTEDIEKHLNSLPLVQNQEIREGHQQILEGHQQILEQIQEGHQQILEQILEGHQQIQEEQRQIKEALASPSRFADTAKAAHTPIRKMYSRKVDKPVTGNLSTVSSFQDQHLSRFGFLSISDGVEEKDRTENPRIGTVLYNYAAVCDEEVNLTAGEEVQIIFEENGWFCVQKNPGRNSEIGFVPMLCVNSS